MAGGSNEKRVPRGSKKKKKKKGRTRDVVVVPELTDDVLVEVLSRVPIKSLCRCKYVFRHWRDLICHPEHHKKLPQTLAGFFCESYNPNRFPKTARHYYSVWGPRFSLFDPSLSFLPRCERLDIVDSCNGLLLCRCWKPTHPETMDYVVCNPASEKWMVVPDSGWSSKVTITRLGFDPAVSSHFYVFELIADYIWYMDGKTAYGDGKIEAVAIYSSKTGVWSLNDYYDEWDGPFMIMIPRGSNSVFFNGALHLTASYGRVVAIDVEGNILRTIPSPMPSRTGTDDFYFGAVYLSQGHLYFVDGYGSDDDKISVWVLEDYSSENWTLKHSVDPLQLFGKDYYSQFRGEFTVISIHPEHYMIIVVCGTDNTLMSYDMDRMRLCYINELGPGCSTPYIPYVPLFSEALADGQ